ncbi:MAG TPA: hypothetical protein VJL89_06080, partial [Thermodesulfovibrionia bacterium]|nr:hypothetical protein [Thermodesulfovibrionia bacterium]
LSLLLFLYAKETAEDLGASVQLVGIMPEFNQSERIGMAVAEYGPYGNITSRLEKETVAFFDIAHKFCTDNGLTADRWIVKGTMEHVIEIIKDDKEYKLIIVSTPTKSVNYSDTLGSLKKFAKTMLPGGEPRQCPVVSVL